MLYLEVVVVISKRILDGLCHLKPAHKEDKLERKRDVNNVNSDKLPPTLRMRKMGTKV